MPPPDAVGVPLPLPALVRRFAWGAALVVGDPAVAAPSVPLTAGSGA